MYARTTAVDRDHGRGERDGRRPISRLTYSHSVNANHLQSCEVLQFFKFYVCPEHSNTRFWVI